MGEIKKYCDGISRRVLLGSAAWTLSLAAAGMGATNVAAQAKVSKSDAKYQDQPKEQQRCDGCVQFQPPNACKIVDGQISPSGWCQLFAAKT
jgi:hypothetical protein